MTEDDIIARVAVEQLLERLPPVHAELLRMAARLEQPEDYVGPWPPTFVDIGRHIGEKYEGRALSESTVRYRRDACYRFLRGEDTQIRRKPSVTAENGMGTRLIGDYEPGSSA
jgi:hypothetical protein